MSDGDEDAEVVKEKSAPVPIPTSWLHPDIVSHVVEERVKVTAHFTAERVEYLSEIPPIWPIFKVPTAVVLDLRDPKFNIVVRDKLLTPDALIKNKVGLFSDEYCLLELSVVVSRIRTRGKVVQVLPIHL